MYLSHFNLEEKPFKVSTDPKFLWLGEKHKEALGTLRYGILHGDGYVVLTGDVGTGKTTLAMALAKDLSHEVIVGRVPYPDVEVFDFLRLISMAYGIDSDVRTKASFRDRFESFLRARFSAGQRAVLILDEAQRMRHEHLDELLQLSSIEEKGVGLLNIVFVGQNEFNEILQEDSNRGLRQRIAINYNLVPLTQAETGQYISHRLNVVRCQREIFTSEAIREIFLFSNGIPRLINIVCDLSLLMAYFEGGEVVLPGTVKQAVERLRLPGERPELRVLGPPHPPGKEDKAGDGVPAKTRSEIRQEAVRQAAGKTTHAKFLWAAGLAFVAVLVGLALLLGREGNPPQDRKVETLAEKRGQERSVSQAEIKQSKEEEVGGALALPLSESFFLKEPGRESDPSAKRKISVGTVQTISPQKVGDQGIRTKNQKMPESKVSGGTPQKASPDSSSTTQVRPGKEKDLAESRSRSPGPTTGSLVLEFPEKGTEEAEPGKAIDWILERRLNKK
jgi:type II secretory pathway predicted ATPase ExeA